MSNYNYGQQPVVVVRKSNGLGVAGFVLALLGLIFCWVPYVNILLWILGFLFSLIGVFKAPRGLAIAGLALSLVSAVVFFFLLSLVATVAYTY